jgi:hypothetical protein
MELLGCATEAELARRVTSSYHMSKWLVYLQLRDEREADKMQKMMSTEG